MQKNHRLSKTSKVLITDIDNTLVGDRQSLAQLMELLTGHRNTMAWGVATGRSLELTRQILHEQEIPTPDLLVCSVGTEIYYGQDFVPDADWQEHLSVGWQPDEVRRTLTPFDFLTLQGPEGQRPYKISYNMEEKQADLDQVHTALSRAGLVCEVIYSHGRYLDILPVHASKGKAITFLKSKWHFSSDNVIVAGDSGNDKDMLSTPANGVVVGNHAPELDTLKGVAGIYFSPRTYAGGIIDGLLYYGFI